MKMLRKWQQQSVKKALRQFRNGKKHFMCLATPGAGKTTMAAEVILKLVEQGLIDYVICICPTKEVEQGIRKTFEHHTKRSFNGIIGALGGVYTYQSLLTLTPDFWEILRKYKVLVILDELHHCAGDRLSNANAWGEKVLLHICDHATYTLGLSGTPWRSDNSPITLGIYPDGQNIECNYVYGLNNAVKDGVCRQPNIVLIDNDCITVTSKKEGIKTFNGFSEAISGSSLAYKMIITESEILKQLLAHGVSKLAEIRKDNPKAGGLVVASSVEHASELKQILKEEFQQSATMVTYHDNAPSAIIDEYRNQDIQWIVSVGMISEGTDIPRLQVCCYLSHVKTEMYYRQVLGRILRVDASPNKQAWFYTFAEGNLVQYANQIQKDLPKYKVIYDLETKLMDSKQQSPSLEIVLNDTNEAIDVSLSGIDEAKSDAIPNIKRKDTKYVEAIPNFEVLGEFRQKVISLFNMNF